MISLIKTTFASAVAICIVGCNSNIPKKSQSIPLEESFAKRDSVKKAEISEMLKDGLYEFKKDTVRQEWVSSHSYMCYQTGVYKAETVGYDKYGSRVTNQQLGVKSANNVFCINRRTKTITWDQFADNGKRTHSEYKFYATIEYRKSTAFKVKDKEMGEFVVEVPDSGKGVFVFLQDVTMTYITTN